jgi:hypothetical protein
VLLHRLLALGLASFAIRALVKKKPEVAPRTTDAVRYNDALVQSCVPVFLAGRSFARAARAALSGEQGALADIDGALLDAEHALTRARAEVSRLGPPVSDSARRLLEAYHALLEAQERILRDDFRVIRAMAQNDKVARIRQTIACVDKQALARVSRAQSAFAEEYSFRIA